MIAKRAATFSYNSSFAKSEGTRLAQADKVDVSQVLRGAHCMSQQKQVLCLVLFLSLPVQVAAETCVMVADTAGVPTPTIMYDGGLFTLEPAFEDYWTCHDFVPLQVLV